MESELKLNDLPIEIFNSRAQDLWQYCAPMSLYHIPGKIKPPLFISILLHGNENAGLLAMQELFKKFGSNFPREVILLVGNTLAAKQNLRFLDNQPDFNRIWHETGPYSEQQLAHDILHFIEQQNVLACIDLHNNTGRNPHYICVNHKKPKFYELASLFEGPTVFFDDPAEVLTMASGRFSPSVIIECGLPDDLVGAQKAANFIEKVMTLDELPQTKKGSFSYYEVVVKIEIPYGVSFAINDGNEEVLLNSELESFNFLKITGEQQIARIRGPLEQLFRVTNRRGEELTSQYLEDRHNKVYIRPKVFPSMFTLNHKVTEQDCLGYLMERKTFVY